MRLFFEDWQQAKALGDASQAYCTVSSVDAQGQVTSRTLVLRELEGQQLAIFINETSPKWQNLLQHPSEILVFWPSMMRQYRIRASFIEIDADQMQKYWQHKPYTVKLLDYFYLQVLGQSSILPSKTFLHEEIARLKQVYPDEASITYPPNAKGLKIEPHYVEQWIWSEQDRLHDRNLFEQTATGWQHQVLVP